MKGSKRFESPPEFEQPIAYDRMGQPLYARPVPQVVHISRAVNPERQPVSEEVLKRHEASLRQYPHLNLSEQEYVIFAVRRHLIGLVIPISLTIILVVVFAFLLGAYPGISSSITLAGGISLPDVSLIALPAILFMGLITLGGIAVVWVYLRNRFFLTNESVIQEIQTSLFSRDEQTVSLANIEDVSFSQTGILPTLLDYGSIRLSTEGDETTYRFSYVAAPKKQTATLNNAVEAFKNGRPIEEN